jgi:hypothetical protein
MEIIRKSILLEDSRYRGEIRSIVRDIVQAFKDNDEGEFYLPEDVSGNHYYDIPKLDTQVVVELTIEPDSEIDDYLINAEYFRDVDIIGITILYNPDNKQQSLYGIVGELNEVIAHELRHVNQKIKGTYDLSVEEPEDPYLYYTQPHEVDAQVHGFKRMSQITKKPFEELVRNWFKTHEDLHGMDDEDVQKVIQTLLDYKNKTNL